MANPADSRFEASWQSDEGLHDGITAEGAEAAIAWGRARARIVWIRLGHTSDTYFSAGEIHPHDDRDEQTPHWPPAHPPDEGWWHRPPRASLADAQAVAAAVAAGTTSPVTASELADLQLFIYPGEHDDGTERLLITLSEPGGPALGWEQS